MVVKVLPVAWRLPLAAVFFFNFEFQSYESLFRWSALRWHRRATHQMLHYLVHHITLFLTSWSTNQPLTSLDSVFQFVWRVLRHSFATVHPPLLPSFVSWNSWRCRNQHRALLAQRLLQWDNIIARAHYISTRKSTVSNFFVIRFYVIRCYQIRNKLLAGSGSLWEVHVHELFSPFFFWTQRRWYQLIAWKIKSHFGVVNVTSKSL